ncbi:MULTISPECIES: hypothetical protein [unclassified Shewanella]|nr:MULTISPECIES: hypothetical protein [unclassified Shewanella]
MEAPVSVDKAKVAMLIDFFVIGFFGVIIAAQIRRGKLQPDDF